MWKLLYKINLHFCAILSLFADGNLKKEETAKEFPSFNKSTRTQDWIETWIPKIYEVEMEVCERDNFAWSDTKLQTEQSVALAWCSGSSISGLLVIQHESVSQVYIHNE